MSDIEEFELVDSAPPPKKDAYTLAIASARDKMNAFLGRAVEIITELAETSENDRVRLAAAESIADRAGLGKSATTQVQVSQAEHDVATLETQELLRRIQENQAEIAAPAHVVPLETLIIHEGVADEDVLTVASA